MCWGCAEAAARSASFTPRSQGRPELWSKVNVSCCRAPCWRSRRVIYKSVSSHQVRPQSLTCFFIYCCLEDGDQSSAYGLIILLLEYIFTKQTRQFVRESTQQGKCLVKFHIKHCMRSFFFLHIWVFRWSLFCKKRKIIWILVKSKTAKQDKISVAPEKHEMHLYRHGCNIPTLHNRILKVFVMRYQDKQDLESFCWHEPMVSCLSRYHTGQHMARGWMFPHGFQTAVLTDDIRRNPSMNPLLCLLTAGGCGLLGRRSLVSHPRGITVRLSGIFTICDALCSLIHCVWICFLLVEDN